MVTFNDGQVGSTMEVAGDFSAWTGTVGAPSIIITDPHHGVNSASFDANESAYKTFAGQAITYMRTYIKFVADCGNNDDDRFYVVKFDIAGQAIMQVGRCLNAGVKKWVIATMESGGYARRAYSTTPAFATGQWYCIEIEAVISGVAGEYHVWFNGVENTDLRRTGKDTNDYGNVVTGFIGNDLTQGASSALNYDCIVIDSSYIGVEVTMPLFTHHLKTSQINNSGD